MLPKRYNYGLRHLYPSTVMQNACRSSEKKNSNILASCAMDSFRYAIFFTQLGM